MSTEQKRLLLTQLDKKIAHFLEARNQPVPGEGWIYSIRAALGMSLKQLGNRLKMTPQGVKDLERREKDGSLTLQKLRDVATALDMQLVYGLVPKDNTLDRMIEKRAMELAREIVLRTSQTMYLENQGLDENTIKEAINLRAEKIKKEMPNDLWN